MSREQQVGRAFVALSDTLADDFDPLVLFQRLVDQCASLLAVEGVGVMMRDARGTLRTMAASSEEALLLELLQLQNNSGPCMECYRRRRSVDVPDLSEERERWPEVVPAALGAGFASMYTVPLRVHAHVLGAVNFFRADRGSLPREDQYLAQALSDVAALALMHWSNEPTRPVDVLTRLQSALAAKAALEIAKGMIAEYGNVSFVEAARMLHEYATGRQVRLTDTVDALIRGDIYPAALLG